MIDIKYIAEKDCDPERMKDGDIGYDLRAAENVRFNLDENWAVSLGVQFKIPEGYYGELTHRSSLAFKKEMACSLGIIDSNFTGTVMALIFNHSGGYQFIDKGERICQIIFRKKVDTEMVCVQKLEKGKMGFGSSGRM